MAELLPRGTLVSQALAADEDIRRMVSTVLHSVDSVHGDGELPTIPVRYSPPLAGDYAEAAYYYDSSLAGALAIRVAYDAETPELSFLQGLGYHFYSATRSSLEAMTQSAFASESNPVFSEWREAVSMSEAVTHPQKVINYRSATVPLADGTEEAVDIDREYVNYLLEPRELFARSYTQYVVANSHNRVLQGQLNSQRQEPLASLYPIYWDDEDFVLIAEAIDSILQQRGWLK